MKKIFCLIFCFAALFDFAELNAQQLSPGSIANINRYLVYFTDKANSPYASLQPTRYLTPKAIARRNRQNISIQQRDWPVNPSYVAQLQAAGASVWYTSRWLNAAVVECTDQVFNSLMTLPIVDPVASGRAVLSLKNNRPKDYTEYHDGRAAIFEPKSLEKTTLLSAKSRGGSMSATNNLNYGQSATQVNMIGVDSMHADGYTGLGITIAVLDAGFAAVDRHDCFAGLRTNNKILGTYDFVERQVGNVYVQNSHGGAVLSIMGGNLDGQLIGPAYEADYYLFRTEDAPTEFEIECAYWVIAAERADSLGCDIINSSLGYNTFDNPDQNYNLSDLDGRKLFMSRAASIAASTGMLVVVSAGNTGGSGAPWYGKITAPSDGDSVLCVGAVNLSGIIASFSAQGPNANGTIKPDVSAPGAAVVVYSTRNMNGVSASSGTSFAAPITAGLAAGLWQAYPSLTSHELFTLLKQSASQASNPDTVYGYGIPNYTRAKRLITNLKDKESVAYTAPRLSTTLAKRGDLIRIEGGSQILSAEVYNQNGQLVNQLNDNRSLNTANLLSGLYVVKIQGTLGKPLRFVVH